MSSSILSALHLLYMYVANGKAVCRMSQISQPSLSTKILILQLCLRASSPFRVDKILIYAMPNADYHKIDLKPP